MAMLRTRDRLISSAPPPSPIATAKGLRSAAVDDQILSEYLEKTLQIPDLTLPATFFSEALHRRIPAEIDLQSLISRDEDSIHQILGSAGEFGVFRVRGHGISADELRSTIAEAECVFRIPMEKKRELSRNFGGRTGVREEFYWFCTENTTLGTLRGEIGPERYQSISKKMDDISGKLEAIAEIVGQIFLEYTRKEDRERLQGRGAVLCLNRLMDPNHPYDVPYEKNSDSFHHALIFHLAGSDHEFIIQSARGPLSFNAGAGTIIITIGKQLEEWSNGKFGGVFGEPVLEPNIDGNLSFFIEFMCSPLTLYHNLNQTSRTISLVDQILIVLTIAFLYNFYTYFF